MPTTLTAPVVIDLGVVDTVDTWWDADDATAPGLPRIWGLLVAVAAVAMVTTALPLPHTLDEVTRFQLGLGSFKVAGHGLYLLEGSRRPTVVASVDVDSGERRWEYVAPGTAALTNVEQVGDVAVLSSDPCSMGITGTTVGIDARDGRGLWQRPGVPLRTPAGTPDVVVTRGTWSDRCGAMLGNGRALTSELRWEAVDRATGVDRWAASIAVDTRIALDAAQEGSQWVALIEPGQVLSVLDFATGVRSPPALLSEEVRWLAAVGELVIIGRVDPADPGMVVLTALHRRSLQPAWTARVSARERLTGDKLDPVSIRPCGTDLCVVADQTTAFDPVSGKPHWQTVRAGFTAVPGGLFADYTIGTGSTPGTLGVALHDPATGRVRIRLDSWRLLGVDERGQRLLVGEATGDTMLFAWLTAAGLEPLSTLGGRFDACQITADRLLCQTNLDELWVLRLKR